MSLKIQPEAQAFWEFIGKRLEIGEERYGGFKFGEHDLAQMSLEELADFAVYVMAMVWIQLKKKG